MPKFSQFGHARVGPGEAKKNPQGDTENSQENMEKKPEPAAENAEIKEESPASAAGEADTETAGTGPANWEQKAAELEVRLADLNDQFLRKAADFENFRKRTIREKQEITEYANQNLLLDLLPVIDDFERAIKSAETSKDFSSFYEGVIMIEKRLTSELDNKWGLKRFNSEGELFDPNRHEAIQMEKSAETSEAVVKDDYLKGYLLKDRVIRFAKVKVLMPEEGSPAAPEAAGDGQKPNGNEH